MCRTTLGGIFASIPAELGAAARSEEKKKKRANLWIQRKAPCCERPPWAKVVTTLHVLSAPGLPLFQYLLYCPVTKSPAPL